jgi:hypothetical protein
MHQPRSNDSGWVGGLQVFTLPTAEGETPAVEGRFVLVYAWLSGDQLCAAGVDMHTGREYECANTIDADEVRAPPTPPHIPLV